ncbi:MAG: class I SAM-dependent methyltransferase [Candidatus Dormibacteraeota bacterium]|nr:class I SAM-dependent methyltransferase [Candidatus Dormibacteraeota bacterium]
MPENSQAVRVGKVTAVAHPDRRALRRFAERLGELLYVVRETPSFSICLKPSGKGGAIVMHTFGETTVDGDLASLVAGELGSAGLLTTAQEYGDALFAIVASTSPPSLRCSGCGSLHLDNPSIWRGYCLNTLRRLRPLLADGSSSSGSGTSDIPRFAAVYRRVAGSSVGRSVLDVGTNLGLLPVLLAELAPGITIVGCDNRPDAVAVARDLAGVVGGGRPAFILRDILAPDFAAVGRFDSVVMVHLLEHLSEPEVPAALENALRVTASRLVVAVPYEEGAQTLFGHRQVFTPEKLRTWGEWCVERLGGGSFKTERVAGGLLVVDRPQR